MAYVYHPGPVFSSGWLMGWGRLAVARGHARFDLQGASTEKEEWLHITVEISSFSTEGVATLLPHPAAVMLSRRGVAAAPLQGRWLSGLPSFPLLGSGFTLPVECLANSHFPHPLFSCEPSFSGFYLQFVVERALVMGLGDLSLL